MSSYRPGTRIKLNEDYSLFTKISNKVFPFITLVLAGYGLMDILLTVNGF